RPLDETRRAPPRRPSRTGRFPSHELVSKSKSHPWPARRGLVRLPRVAPLSRKLDARALDFAPLLAEPRGGLFGPAGGRFRPPAVAEFYPAFWAPRAVGGSLSRPPRPPPPTAPARR